MRPTATLDPRRSLQHAAALLAAVMALGSTPVTALGHDTDPAGGPAAPLQAESLHPHASLARVELESMDRHPSVAATVPLTIGGMTPSHDPGVSPSVVAELSVVAESSVAPSPSAVPSSSATSAAQMPRPVTAAIATLLIYSGRPDPTWSLAQEDLDQLAAIAATLAPADGAPPEGDLGYKGFLVTGPQGTWRANAGVVATPVEASGTSLADPERLVERFLLERGLATLSDEEAAIATEAIGSD